MKGKAIIMEEQMNISFSPPDITEAEVEQVVEALRSGWITTGPKTKEFEKKLAAYMGTNKVVCLSSSTAAMELTLRLLGVGPGDEVILPAYTYTATCSVVCHVGATPVMLDIQNDHSEMDYDQLDAAITQKTKVVMPVDLAGILCDYNRIYEILDKHVAEFCPNNDAQRKLGRIAVLADSAHGLGAVRDGQRSGQLADFTCFSFHAVKNLTTAEGGAVTWQPIGGFEDEDLYKRFMDLSLHGQTKDAFNKTQAGAWEYDIVSPAYKCNMTDIQAGIGLAQLERYPQMLERRHEIIKAYDSAFSPLNVTLLNHRSVNHQSSGHLYLMRINDISEKERNQIIMRLAERGIATNVHYKPLPMMTAYRNMGFDVNNYPNAYDFYKNEITLPLYSKLTNEQVDYIILRVKNTLEEFQK